MFEEARTWLSHAAGCLPSLFPEEGQQTNASEGLGGAGRTSDASCSNLETHPRDTTDRGVDCLGQAQSRGEVTSGDGFEQVAEEPAGPSIQAHSEASFSSFFPRLKPGCTGTGTANVNQVQAPDELQLDDVTMVSAPALAVSRAFYEVKAMFATVQQWSSSAAHRTEGGMGGAEEPAWLLGCQYQGQRPSEAEEDEADARDAPGATQFLDDWNSRILITYRKDFEPLGSSQFTSDVGWGCMVRSAQMLLAQTLLAHRYGRSWRLQWTSEPTSLQHLKLSEVVSLFHDSPSAPLSLHSFCSSALPCGLHPGSWMGPFAVCRGLTSLLRSPAASTALGMPLHVVTDGAQGLTGGVPVLCVEEVEELWKAWLEARSKPGDEKEEGRGEESGNHGGATEWGPAEGEAEARGAEQQLKTTGPRPESASDCPVLLLVPLVLGLEAINPRYLPSLKAVFTFPQCVGALGGKPGSSTYLVGVQGDSVLFLDPHHVQPVAPLHVGKLDDLTTYNPKSVGRMHLESLDPSLALGFYCSGLDSFHDLCQRLEELRRQSLGAPLLIVSPERPPDPVLNTSNTSKTQDNDEEWEIV